MSDGGRGRASLGGKMWKSSQKGSVRRSAVRSIAWLDVLCAVKSRPNILRPLERFSLFRDVLPERVGQIGRDVVPAGLAASPSRKDLYSSPIPPRANLQTAR